MISSAGATYRTIPVTLNQSLFTEPKDKNCTLLFRPCNRWVINETYIQPAYTVKNYKTKLDPFLSIKCKRELSSSGRIYKHWFNLCSSSHWRHPDYEVGAKVSAMLGESSLQWCSFLPRIGYPKSFQIAVKFAALISALRPIFLYVVLGVKKLLLNFGKYCILLISFFTQNQLSRIEANSGLANWSPWMVKTNFN